MKRQFGYQLTRMLAVAVCIAATAGCGNFKVKDNQDKYVNYNDPTVIGTLSISFITHYDYIASCWSGLGYVVANSMLAAAPTADFAVVNAGTVRFRPSLGIAGDVLSAGPITRTDVANFLPFDNPQASIPSTIVLISLSPAAIKEMFENAYSRMLADGTPGTSYGRFLQVSSSIQVLVDATRPVGSRVTQIKIVSKSGQVNTLDMADTSQLYRVAVPLKYIPNTPGFQDYDGYWPIMALGSNIADTKVYIYDSVVNYISDNSPILGGDAWPNCSEPGLNIVITHN